MWPDEELNPSSTARKASALLQSYKHISYKLDQIYLYPNDRKNIV